MDPIWSLGGWLKRRRHQLDLTQAELADRVGCSLELIRKIEQDARRPSRLVAERIAAQLALSDGERALFVRVARGASSPEQLPTLAQQAASIPQQPGNLPAVAAGLIGRGAMLASIGRLLHDARLITLTGPGGIGKTRLALAAAHQQQGRYRDGAWLIDLAPVTAPDQVAPAFARALQIHDLGHAVADRLRQALQQRRCLLLVDNCEHLLDTIAPLVADLLAAAPQITVLATSRAPLGLRAEQVLAVPPLALPARASLALGDPIPGLAPAAEAIELFVARAQAVDRSFALTPASAPAVAEICWRLDGLPLAIELVAAHTRVLRPEELLGALGERGALPLLASAMRDMPARQQTMIATIDWSYALLSPAAQALLARLSVFVGGWTLAAARAVAGDLAGGDVADPLEELVAHSLAEARRDAGGGVRFHMLETVREYARERLRQRGEEQPLRERHAAHWAAWAEQAEPHLRGAEQLEWLADADADSANLRAALEWAWGHADEQGAAAIGLRLALGISYAWRLRSQTSEAIRWLGEAPWVRDERLPVRERAWALMMAAQQAYWFGRWERAYRWAVEATPLARASGDARTAIFLDVAMDYDDDTDAIARARIAAALRSAEQLDDRWLLCVGQIESVWRARDTSPATLAFGERVLAAARGIGDRFLIQNVLGPLGKLYREAGEHRRAAALHTELCALNEALTGAHWAPYGWMMLASDAVARGDLDEAAQICERRVEADRAHANPLGCAHAKRDLAMIALARGQLQAALVLFDESVAVSEAEGEQAELPAIRRGQLLTTLELGQLDRAHALALHHLSCYPAPGWEHERCEIHSVLGVLALARGDLAEADTQLASALAIIAAAPFETIFVPSPLTKCDPPLLHARRALVAAEAGDMHAARVHLELAAAANGAPMALTRASDQLTRAEALARIGDDHGALPLLGDALATLRRAGARPRLARALELAAIMVAEHQPATALRWLAAAGSIRRETGAQPWPIDAPRLDRLGAALRAELGDAASRSAWQSGAQLGWADAAEQAAAWLRE